MTTGHVLLYQMTLICLCCSFTASMLVCLVMGLFIIMESPLHQRGVIDIDATAEKNRSIIPGLLAAHALSGCDTVASYYGINKGKVLEVPGRGTTHLAVHFCLYLMYLENQIYQ